MKIVKILAVSLYCFFAMFSVCFAQDSLFKPEWSIGDSWKVEYAQRDISSFFLPMDISGESQYGDFSTVFSYIFRVTGTKTIDSTPCFEVEIYEALNDGSENFIIRVFYEQDSKIVKLAEKIDDDDEIYADNPDFIDSLALEPFIGVPSILLSWPDFSRLDTVPSPQVFDDVLQEVTVQADELTINWRTGYNPEDGTYYSTWQQKWQRANPWWSEMKMISQEGEVIAKAKTIFASDIVPPVTEIDYESPEPNEHGWYNSDVTIGLRATDDGSGVKEIHYKMDRIDSEEEVIPGSSVQVTIAEEGYSGLIYYAVDNDENTEPSNYMELQIDKTPPQLTPLISPEPNEHGWNNSDVSVSFKAQDNVLGEALVPAVVVSEEGESQEIPGEVSDLAGNTAVEYAVVNIDKTPPETTVTIIPEPGPDGWIREVPVTLSFSAADNLSGVAFTTEDIIIEEEGEREIYYHSKDFAGNEEEEKSVIVKIDLSGEDTTPPEISLKLIPRKWWFLKFHRLVYSATDDESGVKEIKAGLIMPDIEGYKTVLKKSWYITSIRIDERKKRIIIKAPNPQDILAQIKDGLFLIDNNQALRLKKTNHKHGKIMKIGRFITINAPSIIFKAEAEDNAGNVASKQIEYLR